MARKATKQPSGLPNGDWDVVIVNRTLFTRLVEAIRLSHDGESYSDRVLNELADRLVAGEGTKVGERV